MEKMTRSLEEKRKIREGQKGSMRSLNTQVIVVKDHTRRSGHEVRQQWLRVESDVRGPYPSMIGESAHRVGKPGSKEKWEYCCHSARGSVARCAEGGGEC